MTKAEAETMLGLAVGRGDLADYLNDLHNELTNIPHECSSPFSDQDANTLINWLAGLLADEEDLTSDGQPSTRFQADE